MPTFPRTIQPSKVTPLVVPGPIIDVAHAGKINTRNYTQAGYSWKEEFPPLNMSTESARDLMAQVLNYWKRGTEVDVTHGLSAGSGMTPRGLGSGGITVDGAGQTGATLSTAGWPLSTSNVVRAGDVISIAGISRVFMITEDSNSDGSGDATLSILPSIFTGMEPADAAAITTTGVIFKASIIDGPPQLSNILTLGVHVIPGFSLTFRETLS